MIPGREAAATKIRLVEAKDAQLAKIHRDNITKVIVG